jgi:plastocyanin
LPFATAVQPLGSHHRYLQTSLGKQRRTAHAAGDPGDTISDFTFTPGSLTVHVGDTVTWTNNGPSQHTATANNGSFNTGLLHKGASGSHTFTTAGTFTYFCQVHPFMKGTIVVLASSTGNGGSGSGSGAGSGSGSGSGAGSGSGSGSGSGAGSGSGSGSNVGGGSTNTTPAGGSTGGSTNTTPRASGSASPTLPNTGLDLAAAFACGISLIGLGFVVRRSVRPQPGPHSQSHATSRS